MTDFDININVRNSSFDYTTYTAGKTITWDQNTNGPPTEMKIIISEAIGGQQFDQTEIWCTQFKPIESR